MTYPICTILPRTTRVSDAARRAQAANARVWHTDRGQIVVAPFGLPGWRPLRTWVGSRTPEAA